ncbi:MAG TPA: LamG domain-containing protein [Terracidiphilus sp.]|jgi:hypothetical protein
MHGTKLICSLMIGCSFASAALCQKSSSPVAWWKFDENHGDIAHDSAGGQNDRILNFHDWVRGVSGGGLKFDGFTTLVERDARNTPKLQGGFTIDAWVAIQSYPWNWVAIVDQDDERNSGYFFGIDAKGRLGLEVSVWGVWEICQSDIRVPLAKWTHVTGVYDPDNGIHLYINGRPEGSLPVLGNFTPATSVPLRIGRNIEDLPPVALVRKNAAFPAKYSLDGILDEIRIYDRSLSPSEVAATHDPVLIARTPDLAARHWPSFPQSAEHLNAAYTSLSLYPEWDRLWRMGEDSDVVVSFWKLPAHYVFWRGANFGPNMVTENGIWMSDQSFEGSTKVGTAEHMNDKHDMHASISIVETSDARVVLRWRYALVDVLGNFADIDSLTGWGDWAEEYFYIYPDGVAVRNGTIHGTRGKYSFTEPTLLLEPGKKPEDFISLQAATIANDSGESRTYSWEPAAPAFPFPEQPVNANIALVNLKSRFKPFYIYRPGTILGPYGWPPEYRPQYSHFPVWDHWPVNQIPSDGRFALYPDHFASSAIMSPNPKATWIDGPGPTKTTYFLFGLTDGSIADMARLDRSWLNPPIAKIEGSGSAVYEAGQRAYLIHGAQTADKNRPTVNLMLEASETSPVVNPALVIDGWGEGSPSVHLDGSLLDRQKYRIGYRRTLAGTDLIVWLEETSTRPVKIVITSQN